MRDATRGALIFGGVAVLIGVVGFGYYTGRKENERREDEERLRSIHESIDESMRAARAREYEERARGPCGERVEIFNADGDAHMVCARDLRAWTVDGWIVRYPDAGVR